MLSVKGIHNGNMQFPLLNHPVYLAGFGRTRRFREKNCIFETRNQLAKFGSACPAVNNSK